MVVTHALAFCRENAAACVPVSVMLLTETATLGLTLLTVTVMGLLVLLRSWLTNVIGEGVTLM